MMRAEAVRFVAVRSLGNFLVLLALYGVGATFGPAVYYELQYRVIQARGIRFVVSSQSLEVSKETGAKNEIKRVPASGTPTRGRESQGPGFAEILAGAKEQVLIPKDSLFSIVIPRIGASAKIYPNVDPNNPEEFLPVLAKGIAHAKGTVFPGMRGNIYLFAHSTDNWWNVGRYNAVFYLLKDLSEGDEIVVFFENRRYEYTVSQKIISDPKDVTFLTGEQSGAQRLVMQTCWPPGTTWKRLYVIAEER